MTILAIETSHGQGSVAIEAGDAIRLMRFSPGLVHGKELVPAIDRICGEAGVAPGDLELIAVSHGPGSYTGIRIGVAVAKALAWALGVPTLGVSSLEATARGIWVARSTGRLDVHGDAEIEDELEFAVLVDARRGAGYTARFRIRGDRLERITEDRLAPVESIIAELNPSVRLVGTGARDLPAAADRPRFDASLDCADADRTLDIARDRREAIATGHVPPPAEYGDPHSLMPVYLRPSQAEEKRAQRASAEPGESGEHP